MINKRFFSYLSTVLFTSVMAYSSSLFAVNLLSITPVTEPNTLLDGQGSTATYLLTNSQKYTLSHYILKNATPKKGMFAPIQIIDNKSCPKIITLKPGRQCTLKLSVKAPADSAIMLCSGAKCSQAPKRLQISQTPLVLPGAYHDAQTQRPLLAISYNGGSTWSYPSAITKPNISPAFSGEAVLREATCSDVRCLAIGRYMDTNGGTYTLLAQSTNKGVSWQLSSGVNVKDAYGAALLYQDVFLKSIACNGSTCIIGGAKQDGSNAPFLALSNNTSNLWTELPQINAPKNDPYTNQGSIDKLYFHEEVWFALGSYADNNGSAGPFFMARSRDNGATWSFPPSMNSTKSLPALSKQQAINAISCSEKTCIAAGHYQDPKGLNRPFLAISADKGINWRVLNASAFPKTNPASSGLGSLGAVSCANKTCAVGGNYIDTKKQIRPLLLKSSDLGLTWTAPQIITQSGATPNKEITITGVLNTSCTSTFCVIVVAIETAQSAKILLGTQNNKTNQWQFSKAIQASTNTLNFLSNTLCQGSTCVVYGIKKQAGKGGLPLIGVIKSEGTGWLFPPEAQNPKAMNPVLLNGGLGIAAGGF